MTLSPLRAALPVLALLLCAAPASAADPGAECESAYNAGEFSTAATCWTQLARLDGANGDTFYNLGNALHRDGRLGEAIAAWIGARTLLPRDGDVAANLETARAAAKDNLAAPDPGGSALHTLAAVRDQLAPRHWLTLWAISSVLGFGALALVLSMKIGSLRPLAALGAPGALVFGGLWTWQDHELDAHPIAVVASEAVTVRSGKDTRSVDLVELHAGAEVRVLQRDDQWVLVAIGTGQRGWIGRDALAIVLEP